MYLVINTVTDDKFTIGLADKSGRLVERITKKGKFIQAEKILPVINELVKKKYSYKKIKGVIVSRGPGGFTSIRIGIITANTFAYALGIPVVGLKVDEYHDFKKLASQGVSLINKNKSQKIVLPFYGREPNITKSKNRSF